MPFRDAILAAAPDLSPAVAAEYRRLLDRRILPRWADVPLRRLRTADLDQWYSDLRRSGAAGGKPLAPNTVMRSHAVLRRALAQGVKWGWLTVNPAANASPPRSKKQHLDLPDPGDVARLIEAAAKVNPSLPTYFRLAAATGLAGGSIEDAVDRPGETLYDIGLATDRIRAAVEAKRSLPHPFTLTARAENFLVGIPDLADTIRRLQAYQEAGADVLYAPMITTREEITTVVKSVDRPVNFLMGTQAQRFTLAELSAMGVRRVSVGSALATAALGAFLRGAREMRETGTFTYTQEAAGFAEISRLLGR